MHGGAQRILGLLEEGFTRANLTTVTSLPTQSDQELPFPDQPCRYPGRESPL